MKTNISFSIPTYNRKKVLKKCLLSIANYKWKHPVEVVIADGGSTDGTIEFLKKFDKKNKVAMNIIEQNELMGIIKSMDVCFRAAKGEYVMVLNDDCIIVPKVIDELCSFMDTYKQMAIGGTKQTHHGKHIFPYVISNNILPGFIGANFPIVRREVLSKLGFSDTNTEFNNAFGISFLENGYTFAFHKDVGIHHMIVNDEHKKISHDSIKADTKYLVDKHAELRAKVRRCLGNEAVNASIAANNDGSHRNFTEERLERIRLFYDPEFPKDVGFMHLHQRFDGCML